MSLAVDFDVGLLMTKLSRVARSTRMYKEDMVAAEKRQEKFSGKSERNGSEMWSHFDLTFKKESFVRKSSGLGGTPKILVPWKELILV